MQLLMVGARSLQISRFEPQAAPKDLCPNGSVFGLDIGKNSSLLLPRRRNLDRISMSVSVSVSVSDSDSAFGSVWASQADNPQR